MNLTAKNPLTDLHALAENVLAIIRSHDGWKAQANGIREHVAELERQAEDARQAVFIEPSAERFEHLSDSWARWQQAKQVFEGAGLARGLYDPRAGLAAMDNIHPGWESTFADFLEKTVANLERQLEESRERDGNLALKEGLTGRVESRRTLELAQRIKSIRGVISRENHPDIGGLGLTSAAKETAQWILSGQPTKPVEAVNPVEFRNVKITSLGRTTTFNNVRLNEEDLSYRLTFPDGRSTTIFRKDVSSIEFV